MSRNFVALIQKFTAAVLVLNLVVPADVFAARPKASRQTPRVEQALAGNLYAMRAELRTIDDVERRVQTLTQQLAVSTVPEVIQPYIENVIGMNPQQKKQALTVIEGAYNRVWMTVKPESRPLLDRAFALAVAIHENQPVSETDRRPFLITAAARIHILLDEFGLYEAIPDENDAVQILAATWLYGSFDKPAMEGWSLRGLSREDEAALDEIAILIRSLTSDEVFGLIDANRKPADYDATQPASVQAYYQSLQEVRDAKVELMQLAEVAQNLRDIESAPEPRVITGIIPVFVQPILKLLSEIRANTRVKTTVFGILFRAITDNGGFGGIVSEKPYVIFSPDDEEDLFLQTKAIPQAAPLAPQVKEWADKLAGEEHYLSMDLPSLEDLDSGRFDLYVRDGLIYSATTNNNGNLNYLREIQEAARKAGRPNPILAEAQRILRQNPAIARKDAVAQAYENLINAYVARIAIKLHRVYKQTKGRHGFVSTELPTAIVVAPGDDTDEINFGQRVDAVVQAGIKRFEETQKAIAIINNGIPTRNILLKIPATTLGLEAGRRLISLGYNVNFTLVATAKQYRDTVRVHKQGLREFITKFRDIHRQPPSLEFLPQSVSSDFVSRDDRYVRPIIEDTTFGKISTHLLAQRGLPGVSAERLSQINDRYIEAQAGTLDEPNTVRDEVLAEFAAIRGEGPEGTTRVGLAFAQAEILRIQQEEFSGDKTWEEFITKTYAGEKASDLNRILNQQIYWASTGLKLEGKYTTNPFYLRGLVAPYTTNTVPRDVIVALAQGTNAPFSPEPVSPANLAESRELLARLEAAGINLDLLKQTIFKEGLDEFNGSDLASYAIIEDAIALAQILNDIVDGRVQLLEPKVSFAELSAKLEQRLDLDAVSRIVVNGKLIETPLGAADQLAQAPQVSAASTVVPVAVVSETGQPLVDQPVAIGQPEITDSTVTAAAETLQGAQPLAADQPVAALPEGFQPITAELLTSPQANPPAVTDATALTNAAAQLPSAPSAVNPQAELPVAESQERPVAESLQPSSVVPQATVAAQLVGPETPTVVAGNVPSAVTPQLPQTVQRPQVDTAQPLKQSIIKLILGSIPDVKDKAKKHEKFDFVLTFVPETKTLQINFIRSELRILPDDLENLEAEAAQGEEKQSEQIRAEVARYVDAAEFQLSNVVFPQIADSDDVRTDALAAFSANLDDANIFEFDFALEKGGIVVIPTLAGPRRSVIIVEDARQEAFVNAFNARIAQQGKKPILVAYSPEQAAELLRREEGSSVALRAYVSSLGHNADTLKKSLERAKVVVTLMTTKDFNKMIPEGSEIAKFAAAIRQQFLSFAKSV